MFDREIGCTAVQGNQPDTRVADCGRSFLGATVRGHLGAAWVTVGAIHGTQGDFLLMDRLSVNFTPVNDIAQH